MGDDAQKFTGVGTITSINQHADQVTVLLTEHAGTFDCPNTGKTVEFAPGIHTITTHFNSWHPHNGIEALGEDK